MFREKKSEIIIFLKQKNPPKRVLWKMNTVIYNSNSYMIF